MNQEQREYTIKKIEKNKEELAKSEKNSNYCAFLGGVSVLITTLFCTIAINEHDILLKNLEALISISVGIFGVFSFRAMIIDLTKKAGLEVMNEELEYALTMDSLEEENKGRTR